jgi:amidophosphoribosyltransferase
LSVPLHVLGAAEAHDSEQPEKKEKCGVFGIWGTPDAAQVAYAGIFAQQHRGQESAGIVVTDGRDLNGHTGMGLVSQVFNPRMLKEELAGTAAIGHVRYSTTGSSKLCNAQPLLRQFHLGPVAVAHNGNLINAGLIREDYERHGHIFQSTTDTEIIVHLLAKPAHAERKDPLVHVLRHLQGAYSLLFLFPDRIEAVRDPWGVRPLALGKTPGGQWCVASETCALDAIDATYVRDVEPGEIVRIDDTGISSRRFEPPAQQGASCVFEHVYFANPASKVFGQTVHTVRTKMGRQLAREAPVSADYVMPMPDSGRSAALGFAKESCIPFEEGIVPNRFVGRTFILPNQGQRDRAVAAKLNIIPDVVAGQRVVIVEDSVVRGTTTRQKMRAIRRAGAKEIHLRVSCPPIRHPCFYGIDFPTSEELIAHGRTVKEIGDFLEVDSLAYLSLDGMLACLDRAPDQYCTACWSGHYKIPVDHPQAKYGFEREQLKMF